MACIERQIWKSTIYTTCILLIMSTSLSRCFVVQVQGWNEPYERVSGHFLIAYAASIGGSAHFSGRYVETLLL